MSAVSDFYAALGVDLPERGNIHCVFDGHDDRAPSLSINRDTGAFTCFGCDRKGGPYDAAVALGREPRDAAELCKRHGLWIDNGSGGLAPSRQRSNGAAPTPTPKPTCAVTEEQVAGYVAALTEAQTKWLFDLRRWTPEAIKALEVGFDGERITFPLRDADAELVGLVRYRPNPERRNGAEKSKADSGSTRALFGDLEAADDNEVWLTEGENDAVTAESMGLPAVGVGGTSAWQPEFAERFSERKVVILFDCDKPGRDAAQKIANDLAGHAVDVRVLDLEPGREDGYDLTDYALDAETPEELVEAATILRGMAAKIEPQASIAAPPENDRTDRTLSPKPHENGAKVFGLGTEHSPTIDRTLEPPDLASEPAILDRLDDAVGGQGLIGERPTAKVVKLVSVSRLLAKPSSVIVKGDSSTGKSFAVECALNTCAPEGLYIRSQTSALALFYSEEDFRHRAIVFYEANKLGDDDDPLARILRTLISEGELKYEVTVPEKRSSMLLEQEGPVAFISTTCKASLDPEIETRILSLHSDNSDQQTGAVVNSILEAAGTAKSKVELDEWHALDRWLAAGPRDVIVPWGPALATFKLSGPPRLRRDITNLLSLVKAHALLHRQTREVDDQGRILANLDDYEVVSGLLAEALAIATDKAVRPGTREIVNAVRALREEVKGKVSLRAAARKAKRSPSTTHTDAHDALERGYLVNRSETDARYDLDVGDPLPTHEELLPSRAELEEKCSEVFGKCSVPRPNTLGQSQNQKEQSVRSVRSLPGTAAQTALESQSDENRPSEEIKPAPSDRDFPTGSQNGQIARSGKQLRIWDFTGKEDG